MSDYTIEDIVALAMSMQTEAEDDAEQFYAEGGEEVNVTTGNLESRYWDGWAEGLDTLLNHIKSHVKVSCFPIGSCTCHPLATETPDASS
jgi:hypothetical protein